MKHLVLMIIPLGILCNGSLFECPNGPPDYRCGRCTSVNDPHITTLDGVYYDHHQDGCYKYVTKCNEKSQVPFEICGCHYSCGTIARCIGDLSISFFDSSGSKTYDVAIDYLNPLTPAINTLTPSSLISGNSYAYDSIFDTFRYTQNQNEHIFQIYYGGNVDYAYISYRPGHLVIYLDEVYQFRACGLCGLFNTIKNDDFTGSDNVVYVDPLNVPTWPSLGYGQQTVAVRTQVNNFANTYRCTANQGFSLEGYEDCHQSATDCCQDLWNQVFETVEWKNTIVTADDIFDNWIEGCAADACLLTQNGVTTCNTGDEIYQFARKIAVETASKTFE